MIWEKNDWFLFVIMLHILLLHLWFCTVL